MEQNNITVEKKLNIDMPMKWHKFLIYFSLWAGAVMNVFSGIAMLTGSVYASSGTDAATIYRYYDGLQMVDIMMGIASILLAVVTIVARFSLAGYKANGPKLLLCTYVISFVTAIAYPLLASSVTGLDFSELFEASSLGGAIGGFIINKIYYSKRADLFVN